MSNLWPFQQSVDPQMTTTKDYVAALRAKDGSNLSTRLIDTFRTARQQDGIKHPDIVTRLKEQMEASLRSPTDAPD